MRSPLLVVCVLFLCLPAIAAERVTLDNGGQPLTGTVASLSTAPQKFLTHCLRLRVRLFVARSLQISSGYAPRSRLDPDPHSRHTGSGTSAAR